MSHQPTTPRVRVVYADGPDSPGIAPTDALRAVGIDGDAELDLVLGWTVRAHPWLADPDLRARTVLAGYALAPAVAEGRITPLPLRVSAVARWWRDEPPDLAVVSGIRRGSALAFGCSVGWSDVLCEVARKVVVEVDDDAPDLGAPEIPGNVVAVVRRPATGESDAVVSRPADDVDLAIGTTVARLVPEEATLQFGPGAIGEGIVRTIERPVRIWSGLVTEAVAALADRGLLAAPATATYAWGGDGVRRLADSGMLHLRPASVTHDLTAVSAIPRFVGCNTAVQVSLDGAVNIERSGTRVITSIGGHADYCTAASRSAGGLSIIAVRATTTRGHSTIVPRVDVVSTARSDVDVVVTEHGIADLRGLGDTARAERLVGVAAPEHRDALHAAMAGVRRSLQVIG